MEQITLAPRNHLLTNINTWTPDNQWLVFGVHPFEAPFTGGTVGRMNVYTGEVEIIYRASQGAHVDVVTVHPGPKKYVFTHGPENPDETQHYDSHHRRGVATGGSKVNNFDAMDIIAPYTPGVLHDDSHVRVFSPNGERMSFTYSDHIIHELDPALDLRSAGVATSFDPFNVQKQHPHEYSSNHWYVLVSKTTPTPQPNSSKINRTYEGGWVGNHALASIGDILSPKGEKVSELFIVELPRDGTDWRAADDAPLSGTETTLLVPSRGIVRRRLTFTHHWIYPGLANVPCHWVCHNLQGTQVTFLMCDDNDIVQLWLISPRGDEPHQLTHNKTDIQSTFNWHPSGEWLGFVLGNRAACAYARSDKVEYLTGDHANPPSADVVVSSLDGQWLVWMEGDQLWITKTDR